MIKVAKSLSSLGVLLALAGVTGCGGDAKTHTDLSKTDPQAPVSDWQLVWQDEFDDSQINAQNWTHEVDCLGGGNEERQCYTDDKANSYVSDGTLKIVALGAADNAEKPYTSARLITRHKADFKYGRFEIRAKLPSGQGSWPAFWMLPTDEVYGGWPNSGEIDIVEAVNLKAQGADGAPEAQIYGTLHYGKDWPDNVHSGKAYTLPGGANPADDFHTYAVEWQEGEIRWYVDDYLYATQRQSEPLYDSNGDVFSLKHRGWFAEYHEQGSGELTTHWDSAPFDQNFYLILNLAVGGNWPEAVNETGVNADAFANGQIFEVDYVRVYQCQQNPTTGKGCETIRAGWDSSEDALVEGKAPTPPPPATAGDSLQIFDGELNKDWPAWDCCGGSVPALVEDDTAGTVIEFSVGSEPTVNGFISRDPMASDAGGTPSPFDASSLIDSGMVRFDLKVTSAPVDTQTPWMLKAESANGEKVIEIPLSESTEGLQPVAGQWQTFTFPLQMLAERGLDISSIDAVLIFPAWGSGEGAVYRVAEVAIAAPQSASALVVFEDSENPAWPMWDCCGGSVPTVELDDDAHGNVAEFKIGDTATVMGFISRQDFITAEGVSAAPFDASSILSNGVVEFDMKVVSAPQDTAATWSFKAESVNAESVAEVALDSSVQQAAPEVGQWQTYTFKLTDLVAKGLDISAIDVLMVFPTWGQGAGAVYRIDNVKIYDPNQADDFVGEILFADDVKDKWSLWDCCGGSTPTLENDDMTQGMVAEFKVGAEPTVMGLFAEDDHFFDASAYLESGSVQFDLKVVTAPSDSSAPWKFKIEALDADSALELNLTESLEATAPQVGQWQTYTFPLQVLSDGGVNISGIDIIMVYPAWGQGEGAVYRLDNVMITAK
ncbi:MULTISPECIES: glycoside hydrolase family 16 protein [unclassified Pseudoalteromonas]|uniref:glycoside hydrolase family 16 protein n=1 Tax=unclassified Pseudoalteromonas TaxID=194690 RepID=UPI00209750DA|nr:glycoside hydrolase family 16 protein [Pseudoalteromonas sp. XMcav2-N]MCO7190483.1 family 16 glycosylhydrolase [Pseudoalteromonas sp. XMcav2-N]